MQNVITRTDLTRKTREVVDAVQRGEITVVESYGKEQIVLLDAMDYHILRAAASYAANQSPAEPDEAITSAIHDYLSESISLSRAAERLDMSRFELLDRFERLSIPLRLGPRTKQEAQDEVNAALETLQADE